VRAESREQKRDCSDHSEDRCLPAGRPAGNKNKVREESKNMEKYTTRGEKMIVKTIDKIGKEIKKNMCKQMEKMNGIVMEQIEHQKRVEGRKIDKRRTKKEE